MKFLAASIILSVTAGLRAFSSSKAAEQVSCQHPIHCPCGSTGKNVTICTQEDRTYNPCSAWSKCKRCLDGLDKCLECPKGRKGSLCPTATRRKHLSRQKRQYSSRSQRRPYQRRPNQGYPIEAGGGRPESTLVFCQDPGVDSNGRRNPRLPLVRDGFQQGARLQYTCNQGYNLEGESNIYCLISGEWSAGRPRCNSRGSQPGSPDRNVIFCRDPGVDPNGRRNPRLPLIRQGFTQGTRLEYICNQGYYLEGDNNIFCLVSGEWSSSRPRCNPDDSDTEINFCRDPGVDPNGSRKSLLDSTPRGFPQGTRLDYSCNPGYDINGARNIYCLTSGEWSSARPGCNVETPTSGEVSNCLNPGPIPNGKVKYYIRSAGSVGLLTEDTPEYPQGTRLLYYCDEGFSRVGAASLTCDSSGSWTALPPTCVIECGRSAMGTTGKVYNGNRTVAGEWPWVVGIAVQEGNYSRLICGGAVLNAQTVITAAHCLFDADEFILYFGKYYRLDSRDDDQVLVRTTERLIIYPDYDNDTLDSDIALVTFNPKIQFSERIRPICLPTGETTALNLHPGKGGYVTGWGVTQKRRESNTLLLAYLPYVSNSECIQSYRDNVANFNLVLTQNMFCAGYPTTNQTTCSGDSGSPLVFYDPIRERYTLEGLVSFSVEGQCGLPGRYSVFTKVHRFLPWIHRNVRIN